MTQFVGLDVSQKDTAVSVVDEEGRQVWRGKVKTDPNVIADTIASRAPRLRAESAVKESSLSGLWTNGTGKGGQGRTGSVKAGRDLLKKAVLAGSARWGSQAETKMTSITEAPAISAPAYSDWQGATGEGWAANASHYETMLADVGAALLDHAGFLPGERVVEIGCGSGRFARRVAAAVAPDGAVLGLDISPALGRLARQEAAETGTGNLQILVADAQTAVPPGAPFGRLVSRFGVMFFADPAAAMSNLHAMLASGGRLDFAVWAGIDANPWAGAIMEVARTHLGLPRGDPRAPGPFAFSDEAHLRTLLVGAGFQAVRFTPWQGKVRFGGPGVSAAEAAGLAVAGGTLAGPIQAASEKTREALLADLAARFQPYLTDAGALVPASVHLVTAAAAGPTRAGTGPEPG